jgi:hypothetical protein
MYGRYSVAGDRVAFWGVVFWDVAFSGVALWDDVLLAVRGGVPFVPTSVQPTKAAKADAVMHSFIISIENLP